MRVYIPLAGGTVAESWEQRHGRGEVPDASPYGLHHLTDHGFDVSFGDQDLGRGAARIAGPVRHRAGGLELLEAWSHRRQVSSRSTDVVLGYDERTGVPAALLGRRRRIAPVVTGVGWLTTRAEAPPRQRWLAARALPRAAAVWTQCSAMAPILESEWGLRPGSVGFVPVGIDTAFFAVQPWSDGPPTVVSAGEDRFRDHDLLVDAVRSLQPLVPGVRLELATGLPTTLDDGLGTLYTGRMGGRMRELYARSSVVAVALRPTPTGSGLTVVLEAMASGRPLVVTDNPGMSDYVEHGVTGLLVPPDDPVAFAAAVRDLLEDPDRCREMGRVAAERCRARFTSADMSATLAGILTSVV